MHQNAPLIFWLVVQGDGRSSSFEGRSGWFQAVSGKGKTGIFSKEAIRIPLLHQR